MLPIDFQSITETIARVTRSKSFFTEAGVFRDLADSNHESHKRHDEDKHEFDREAERIGYNQEFKDRRNAKTV